MLLAAIDWTYVIVALITTVPGAVAAWNTVHTRRELKTPSGTKIGRQVESAHHVALGNNYRLRALTGELSVATPPQARREETASESLEPDGEDAN